MAAAQTVASERVSPAFKAFLGPLGVAVLAYALMLLVGERLLNDPDTYWHIAAGDWIWAHGAVPSVDPFSYTMAGQPWTAHEWLAELILAGAYAALGWAGVVALAALAIALAFALLARALRRWLTPLVTLAGVASAFYLAAAHLTARPHVLALPILIAWVALMVRARSERRAPSLAALPLMTLWANLHGGFVIGLGLAGAFAVEAVLTAQQSSERRAALRHWGGFIAGAALASLVTPQGVAGWFFPFKLMSLGSSLGFVSEWHAPDFTQVQPIEVWLLGLLALCFAIGLTLPPLRALLLLALAHMALSHSRNAELLAFIAPLILAQPIAASLGRPAPPSAAAGPRAIMAALLALALATSAAVARGYSHDNPKIAPRAALAAAAKAGIAGPIFNDYDFGGYLIFRGIRPFVDGRIDLYGDRFMRAYEDALDAEPDALPRLLDRYHVTWTLLQPDSRAVAALDRLPGWERVYADPSAVIHRRIATAP